MSMPARHPLGICAWAFALAMLSTTCAQAAPRDYAGTVGAAQAAQQQAISGHCAWSITDPAITKAQKLHEQGEDQAATAAAAHAKDLAELSLKQCAEQKTAWRRAVVQ